MSSLTFKVTSYHVLTDTTKTKILLTTKEKKLPIKENKIEKEKHLSKFFKEHEEARTIPALTDHEIKTAIAEMSSYTFSRLGIKGKEYTELVEQFKSAPIESFEQLDHKKIVSFQLPVGKNYILYKTDLSIFAGKPISNPAIIGKCVGIRVMPGIEFPHYMFSVKYIPKEVPKKTPTVRSHKIPAFLDVEL